VAPAPLRPPQTVEFSVVEPEPVEQEPEPEPEPEPEKAPEPPKVVKAPKPVVKAPEPSKQAEPPPAAEETIADFTGTTLTSEATGGWASAVGSGAAMNAPIGKANAQVTGRDRAGVQGGVVGGSGLRVVGEAELTRRPKPPDQDVLNAALEKHYPRGARDQGIEGVARIKVRVLANGAVQPLATLSESYPGFAEACKASMRNQSWTPALDSRGQPVATDLPYKCDFAIE
jgi:outer membrane biosynthesis protein TonB